MRAAWYTDFGPARDVIETGEIDTPAPGPGEVAVEVAISGVNPVDVKRRAGGRGSKAGDRIVPHFDGAGTVVAVGENVDEDRVGQRVWLYEGQWQRTHGTAAEVIALPAERAVPLPKGASFDEGAALGIPAMTAHRCVYGDGPVIGRTVLVTGGAGAVGNYAIQFAKLGGAEVLTTVSSDEKAELAARAGADHVVNYRAEDVAGAVERITDGNGVDRIVEVEFGGNLETSVAVLRQNGVIAAYASDAVQEPRVPFYTLVYKNVTVRHELVFIMPPEAKEQAVHDINHWLAEGRLVHHIGPRFPLAETAAAHEAVESHAFGKVLVDVKG